MQGSGLGLGVIDATAQPQLGARATCHFSCKFICKLSKNNRAPASMTKRHEFNYPMHHLLDNSIDLSIFMDMPTQSWHASHMFRSRQAPPRDRLIR